MNYVNLLKKAGSQWAADKASVWAASMAYYTVFSLAPLLLLLTGLIGIFFGEQAIQGKLFDQLADILGKDAASVLEKGISNTSKPSGNIISVVIGIVVLLLGATGVFDQMQQAFNAIWKVTTKPKAGIGAFIKDRILSFSMLLIIAFLIAISVGLSFFTSVAGNYFGELFFVPLPAVEGINLFISFLVLTILFAAMFKILPDVQIPFKAVWPGALITSILFVLGKFLLGWYIGRSAYTSTYGAAGALLVILVWVYYAVQLVLLGVEITKVYTQQAGIKIVPSKHAVSTEPVVVRQVVQKDTEEIVAQVIGYTVIGIVTSIFSRKRRKKKR